LKTFRASARPLQKKLREAGYITVESIATSSPAELAELAEIGDTAAKKMIKAAREMSEIDGFRTGKGRLRAAQGGQENSRSGSPILTPLLGGGLENPGDYRTVR
jgi:DNA repair protein RadA